MHIINISVTYSWLSLSRPRLSWITAYLEVKIWSLPKHENLSCKKYCEKEEKLLLSNFSSFPQYFQYILTSRVQLHIYLFNVVNRISFSSILQVWYVEVWISRSISESPLEFEITRVNCICNVLERPKENCKRSWFHKVYTINHHWLVHLVKVKNAVILCRNIFSASKLHMHILQYVCNVWVKFWKDPRKALTGVDFTNYALLTIINYVQLS